MNELSDNQIKMFEIATYNRALDDFINELELDIMRYEFSSIALALPRIKKIAEQLKKQRIK